MRVNSWQFTGLSVVGAVVLLACAGVPPSVSPEPAGKHYSSVDEAVRDLAAAAAEPTRSVPTVRVFVPSNYTTPQQRGREQAERSQQTMKRPGPQGAAASFG